MVKSIIDGIQDGKAITRPMGYKMVKAMTDGNERVYKFLIDVYANKKRINESLRQKQEWQRKDIHIK